MTEEMIERAARAAYEKFNENLIGPLEPAWDELEPSFKDRMLDAQRAALSAIPTPELREASENGLRLVDRDQLWNLFVAHYWDSFQKDRDLILSHVVSVLGMIADDPSVNLTRALCAIKGGEK